MNAPVTPQALGDPWTIPLDQLDVADPQLFQDDVWPDWFARLRRDDPVHFHEESRFGPFWSVTKFADIMTVEAAPAVIVWLLAVRSYLVQVMSSKHKRGKAIFFM